MARVDRRAIGGTEDDFAEMMTAQGAGARHDAHDLRQRFRPARRRQITTAHDLAILARAI